MSEFKGNTFGLSAEKIETSIRGANIFRRDKPQLDYYLTTYGAVGYGLPFKYDEPAKDNLSSIISFFSGVLFHGLFNAGAAVPNHFALSRLPDVLKKKSALIREVIINESSWAEDVSGFDFDEARNKVKVDEDGEVSIDRDMIKELIDTALKGKKKNNALDDYAAIDMLRLPCCRRVLFMHALSNPENLDVSIDYKMADNFLKNHTNTSLEAVIDRMRSGSKAYIAEHGGSKPSLNDALDHFGIADCAEFAFAPVLHDLFYDVIPDTIILAALIYEILIDTIKTLPKTFEAYFSLMECLFAVSTLAGTNLVIRNLTFACREVTDKETEILLKRCIAVYFTPMAFSMDAIRKGFKDPRSRYDSEIKKFEDPKYDSGFKKIKKSVIRGGLDKAGYHMMTKMFEMVNENSVIIGAEQLGATDPLTSLRVQSIIQLYSYTASVLTDLKRYFEGSSASVVDMYTLWSDINAKSEGVQEVCGAVNSHILATDLTYGIIEVVATGELRIHGVEGDFHDAIGNDSNGATGNAVGIVSDNMKNLLKFLKNKRHHTDLNVSGEAFKNIYIRLHLFISEVTAITDTNDNMAKLSNRIKEILSSDEFDSVEFKEISDSLIELKNNGTNPIKMYHDMVPAHLAYIDNQLLEIFDSGVEDGSAPRAGSAESTEYIEKLKSERLTLDAKLEELNEKTSTLVGKVQNLTATNQSLEAKIETGKGTVEIPDAVINYLTTGAIATVPDALVIAQHTLGDKVVILPSAIGSAEESEYGQPDRVLREITVLATMFLSSLEGGGTEVARKLFPTSVYRAGESDSVVQNEKLIAYRKFSYQGEKQIFTAHLAMGSSHSKTKHIRIYFKPEIENNRVVVAYCGRHLPAATS